MKSMLTTMCSSSALPLAISYAGLIPGTLLFLLCGMVTNYTGKVLAHIMAAEPSLRTYADIGNSAFGPQARLLVSFFFCLELWAVSTALVILFGDSLYALILSSAKAGHPAGFILRMAEWSPAAFKAIGILIVLPTMFLPLRLLSPVSVIGIVSVFSACRSACMMSTLYTDPELVPSSFIRCGGLRRACQEARTRLALGARTT